MGKGNIHIFKKRRLLRFCLWRIKNFATFWTVVKGNATVDVYGVCYIPFTPMCNHKVYFVVIHIGVGYLGVARSDYSGQCEGLWCVGRVTGTRFPRFFFLYGLILSISNRPVRESADIKWNTYEKNEINPHFILVSCFMQQGHS